MSRCTTEPRKWPVHPAMTQISLGIRLVWSESSLSPWRDLGSLATHWAHSEDSDQTGRMSRLIWVLAGRTCDFVCFVTLWLNYLLVWFRLAWWPYYWESVDHKVLHTWCVWAVSWWFYFTFHPWVDMVWLYQFLIIALSHIRMNLKRFLSGKRTILCFNLRREIDFTVL